MAREFLVHEGSVHSEAGFLLGSSEAFLLLCMIVVSLSIISMVIFACGDSSAGRRHANLVMTLFLMSFSSPTLQ
ncbi:hypothetical protein SADUNF_Sadunf11G0034600 [Salix dunnii]|uniref:Uncharacterized protein n=1 Tax=Salix dunnii TaxID=1413687 RepID=A0A835JST9_9ROSI|nr:hypothetical protein SADUNF_Sadunf11G0034600 [Salix dunnii]